MKVKKDGNKVGSINFIITTSYPGHNILTEDIGLISNIHDCSCSRLGKRFKIFGRLKAEIRGCIMFKNKTKLLAEQIL